MEVGVPAPVINKDIPSGPQPDLAHDMLPDMISQSVADLLQRVEQLEKQR